MFKIITSILLLGLFTSDEVEIAKRLNVTKFKDSITLESYDVMRTFKFSEDEFFLIARPKKYDIENEGLRLIFLKRIDDKFQKVFESSPQGEAFQYRPEFHRFKDETTFILCEVAYEYTIGFDVFKKEVNNLKYLGFVNLSGDSRDPVVDQAYLYRENNATAIRFSGTVEINAPSDSLIHGSKVIVHINDSDLKTEIKK
jgi:hypothetical protein